MTIAAGTRFGPYEILTSLGAGGMGEVYRARDTKLGRDVALKILPAAFASDPDRLARFEREARTLAALNHPHIAQIYGFEDRALAMELVEGEDLAERIGRGPVPLDEALPIARQIADALQAAHDQGIIHRDLKPANIKLRADGFVKVLDFGLAKALSLDSSLNTLPSSLTAATLTSPAVTAAGIILGTASYMSPEQARGKAVDTRADVWAFGVVLYEMLTGALPFAGETTTDVLAAVVRADVDFAHLPAATPLSIRRLLRRCLAKDPSRRLRDMADTRLEIDDAIADPPESAAATVAAPASRRPRRWFIVGLLAVLAALIPFAVMGVRHLRERVALLPEIRFDVPSSVPTIAGSDAASFALSPDARHLAYIDGARQLWIRSMDSPTPRLLPGATDVRYLVWSPDGRAIAFNAGMQLKRINADGSGLTTLMALPSFFGMTWGEGAVLLVAITEGIVRLPAGGGEQTVVVPAIADRVYGSPRFVAGGRFVFLSAPKSLGPRRKVHAASLDSPQPTELFEADAPKVEFVGSGFLLMVEQGTLYARPFDRTRFAVTGEPVAVMRDVAPFSAVDGAIAYRPPTTGGLLQLAWLDRSGRVLESVGEALQMGAEVELAPDGRQAATVRMVNGNFDLWLVETARGVASRVTTTPTLTRWPTWSPDGRRLVYAEANDLHAIDVDGSGAPQVLFADPQQKMPSDMAPDGKHLIYRAQTNADPRGDLWILPLEGEPKPVPFSVTEARETRAQFSPDGRWVSYDSDESGRMEVYVRPFQRPGARVRVSIDGGVEGRWHGNGREMFFVDPQGQLMSVALRPSADGRALDVERPRALFHTRLLGGGSYPANFKFHYDVSRDGERFLMLQASDEATAATIAVIANWVPRPR